MCRHHVYIQYKQNTIVILVLFTSIAVVSTYIQYTYKKDDINNNICKLMKERYHYIPFYDNAFK